MSRDEALQMMSPRLYYLLGLMHASWRNWRPNIGWKPCSAGFNSGGSVSSFEDLECEGDRAAIDALEVGWETLTLAERTVIEQCIGTMPWVFTVREDVLASAIEKLDKRVRV